MGFNAKLYADASPNARSLFTGIALQGNTKTNRNGGSLHIEYSKSFEPISGKHLIDLLRFVIIKTRFLLFYFSVSLALILLLSFSSRESLLDFIQVNIGAY